MLHRVENTRGSNYPDVVFYDPRTISLESVQYFINVSFNTTAISVNILVNTAKVGDRGNMINPS